MASRKASITRSSSTKVIRKATCVDGHQRSGTNKYRTQQKNFGDAKRGAKKH